MGRVFSGKRAKDDIAIPLVDINGGIKAAIEITKKAAGLNDQEIDAVFSFGYFTRCTIKNIKNKSIFCRFYDDKKTLIKDLKEYISKKDIVYVKGSRGMKMEDIIEGLKK